MNTKHLILTLSLTLAASAAVAALTYGYVEPVKVAPTVESTATAPPPRGGDGAEGPSG